jgi:hypothetical protein
MTGIKDTTGDMTNLVHAFVAESNIIRNNSTSNRNKRKSLRHQLELAKKILALNHVENREEEIVNQFVETIRQELMEIIRQEEWFKKEQEAIQREVRNIELFVLKFDENESILDNSPIAGNAHNSAQRLDLLLVKSVEMENKVRQLLGALNKNLKTLEKST